MEVKVNLSPEEEEKLLERAKEEVRDELTDEAVLNYIKNAKHLPIIEFLREFQLFDKADVLDNTAVKDLSKTDKMTLLLKWLIYEKFV